MRDSELVRDLAALCCIRNFILLGSIEIIMQVIKSIKSYQSSGRFARKLPTIS